MFAAERKKRIKRYLLENKKTDVTTLSNLLGVSSVTIRRDLQDLEDDEFLIRTHGGAILNEEDSLDDFKSRDENSGNEMFIKEKSIIGQIASLIIPDNSSVVLCPGKTCEHIASAIKAKQNLRAVTMDINVLIALAKDANNATLSIMVPGGELDIPNLQIAGSMSEQMLGSMHFDYAIVEVDGISLEKGYSVQSFSKASIINKVVGLSDQVIAVCDHSRFDQQSLFQIGDIRAFSKVISTESTPDKFKEFYYNNNIQLLTTFDVY